MPSHYCSSCRSCRSYCVICFGHTAICKDAVRPWDPKDALDNLGSVFNVVPEDDVRSWNVRLNRRQRDGLLWLLGALEDAPIRGDDGGWIDELKALLGEDRGR